MINANLKIFESLSKTVSHRRPAWKFIIEDGLVRILTMQFIVDCGIVNQILESGDYELVEVISHNSFGIVICIRYTGGK